MEILFFIFVIICLAAIVFVISQFKSSSIKQPPVPSPQPSPVTPNSEVTDLLIQKKILVKENQDFRKQIEEEKKRNEQASVQILDLNKVVIVLREENQKLIQQRKAYEQQEQRTAHDQVGSIEGLKKENGLLKEEKERLDQELKRIKEFNRQLLEKEKVMQYDLIRNRAQAVGLEKICEDLKIKIEQMSKINEAKHEETS